MHFIRHVLVCWTLKSFSLVCWIRNITQYISLFKRKIYVFMTALFLKPFYLYWVARFLHLKLWQSIFINYKVLWDILGFLIFNNDLYYTIVSAQWAIGSCATPLQTPKQGIWVALMLHTHNANPWQHCHSIEATT